MSWMERFQSSCDIFTIQTYRTTVILFLKMHRCKTISVIICICNNPWKKRMLDRRRLRSRNRVLRDGCKSVWGSLIDNSSARKFLPQSFEGKFRSGWRKLQTTQEEEAVVFLRRKENFRRKPNLAAIQFTRLASSTATKTARYTLR